jgi:tetratricopeptide (TPR) repeat protein
MTFTLHLHKAVIQAAVVLVTLVICVGLLRFIYERFAIDAMLAKKALIQLEVLGTAVQAFPRSARLQARVAEVLLSQPLAYTEILSPAETAAELAAMRSPFNARYRLLLASVKGIKGDRDAEEKHLRAALTLAPHNTQFHWRLANTLLRAGKITEAADEFRIVVTADPALLASTLDVLWQLTEGDREALVRATGERARNRVQLARFLLQQSRGEEALRVVREIERSERVATPEMGEFLNDLIAGGKMAIAHQFWIESQGSADAQTSLIWNGSFEGASPAHFSQFDWQLRSSEYAQLTVDQYLAHTGGKSLRLDFAGRDTTRLTNEIKQTIVVQPGTRYRLTCFVKTARLLTPEGPRLAVTTPDAAKVLFQTAPINAESSEWQPLTLEFTAPLQSAVFLVTVQRTPSTNYDDPTQGTIWFDDFTLTALSS